MRFTGRKVFLTGGTGFIGGVLARRLLGEGADLTCLVRPKTDAEPLAKAGATIVRGNVTEPATLVVPYNSTIIHGAAWVGFGIPKRHRETFLRTNIEGTRNVLAAAQAAGATRFVHVSSVAALGESERGEVLDESHVRERAYRSDYERSKTETHLLVERALIPSALPMPSLVLGTGGPLEWLVRDLARGKLKALPSGDAVKGWVHVDDTVDAILECALRGSGGYILNDANERVADLMTRAMEAAGLKAPRARVPLAALVAGAAVVEGFYTLRRKTPPISREIVQKLRVPMRYDASRANNELGWKPRLAERLVADMRAYASAPESRRAPA